MTPRSAHDLPRWLRAALAAPDALYDAGLGALLGHRFLRLVHTGRRTGAHHHVVLEVVAHDERSGAVVVASGFGPRADWYRNVTAGGPVWVDFGHGPRAADHEVLDPVEATAVLEGYERRHRLAAPVVRAALGALVGRRYRGTAQDRARLVGDLPFVRFSPAGGPAGAAAGTATAPRSAHRPTTGRGGT